MRPSKMLLALGKRLAFCEFGPQEITVIDIEDENKACGEELIMIVRKSTIVLKEIMDDGDMTIIPSHWNCTPSHLANVMKECINYIKNGLCVPGSGNDYSILEQTCGAYTLDPSPCEHSLRITDAYVGSKLFKTIPKAIKLFCNGTISTTNNALTSVTTEYVLDNITSHTVVENIVKNVTDLASFTASAVTKFLADNISSIVNTNNDSLSGTGSTSLEKYGDDESSPAMQMLLAFVTMLGVVSLVGFVVHALYSCNTEADKPSHAEDIALHTLGDQTPTNTEA
jgi:hypothetical protein